ncbi:MAG TPA: hypothetical protein VFI31_01600 [Pirellulales bacterium]|nr:hypothetical protein [Pirellulales bacterium]
MKRFVVAALGVALSVTGLAGVTLADVKKGEQMVVASRNAPVMRGHSTLATLPAGHRFNVLRTEGNWVGTKTNVGGREVSGWLWRGQVATPQQFAARRQAARRYSYQPGTTYRRYSFAPAVPGAATPYRGPYPYATNTLPRGMGGDYITGGMRSDSPLIMGATRYGQNYWRADRKIIGY